MKVNVVRKRRLEDYRGIVPREDISKVQELAEKLEGISVVHINSTAFGGGVAEILSSMVPLMRSIGLKTDWEVIEAPNEFFNVTKLLHHGIQGMKVELTDSMRKLYLRVNRENSEKLDLSRDIIVVHDPQPAAIRYFREGRGRWVWRCHIDASSPYKPIWDFIGSFIRLYDAYIFHMEEYIQPDLNRGKAYVIKPSIDPLSNKNREISISEIENILAKYDIDPDRPIIIQVARFDPWKDPIGAIDVYRKVKEKIPGTQLLLISSMAHDDPEGWVYYEKTTRYAGNDYDIHFLTNLIGVGDIEVNAFQRAADVALQMSTREGFGLSVTEALWKGTPVVARGVGGIKVQVINGKTGFLVEDIRDATEKVILLLKNKDLRDRLGNAGKEHVRKNFLITRHLYDYLKLFFKLLS